MIDKQRQRMSELIAQQQLPPDYADYVEQYFNPITTLVAQCKTQGSTLVIGVNGCQGSGKTTLSLFLREILALRYQYRVAVLSIDDFYYGKLKRKYLADTVHPLLATRGVPGTHDLDLAVTTIEQLQSTRPQMSLVRFDKATDDRCPEADWPCLSAPVDVVILEGWCVGLGAQQEKYLRQPINQLEAQQDPNQQWRLYVNQQLEQYQRRLFSKIQLQLTLLAPSFDVVYHWRLLQEQKLRSRLLSLGQHQAAAKLLNEQQLQNFIEHYQRLTQHGFETLPQTSQVLLNLDASHAITDMRIDLSLRPG